MIYVILILAALVMMGYSYLRKPKCSHCGSRDTKYGYSWTRGYNDLCRQATGDSGRLCNNCNRITWDKTLAEYKAILPNWCRAYEDRA